MIRRLLSPLATSRSILFLVLLWGSYFRFSYLLRSGPFVDEFATLLAAQGILRWGVPILPSGNFYGHGLLFSYLDLPFVYLFGLDPLMARIPSLVAGLLIIPLTYLVGGRIFSPRVGLMAALLLALDGETILWAARARPYAWEQFLALLAAFLFYEAGSKEDGSRHLWAAGIVFLAALFSHAEVALLLPAMLLGLFLLLYRRRAWRLEVALVVLLCGLGVLIRFLLQEYIASGMGGQFETVYRSRPPLGPSLDLVGGLRPLAPFFLAPSRLLPTLLALGGLFFLVVEGRGGREVKPSLYLYLILAVALLEVATLIGRFWQHPRYIFMLLPFLFLVSAWALDSLLLVRRPTRAIKGTNSSGVGQGWLTLIALVSLSLFSMPSALEASAEREMGYEQAFNYVRERWREDDMVMTVAPAACGVYLPRCDFFAIQRGYEPYVMRERGGVWIDRWVGSPLLDSVEALGEVLQGGSRVWFVVDAGRFRTRYEGDFKGLVEEAMAPVFSHEGVLVFLKGEP
ncbi:MAG: glycosyltransferase family 39 protein [Anaerolineae bacterium]